MNTTLIEPAPTRGRLPTAHAPGGRVWRVLAMANFAALIVAAVVLRGWQLGNIPGLNGDEAWLGVQAAHLAAGEPIAWQTPTGNPVNLCLLLPVAALHLVFGPSVVVLRAMALVSGVAALGVNFWLCRRVFDRRAALVSTALLAVLPIAIAYSRFAWDASQTILATLLVLYYALATIDREIARPTDDSGNEKYRLPSNQTTPDWLPALLAFGVAIWIHPTNVFALWLLIVPAVYRYGAGARVATGAAWQKCNETWGARGARRLASLLAMAAIGLAVAAGWFCRGLLATVAGRLIDPAQGALFLRRLVQLFSGSTIFEFIPGAAQRTTGLDAADFALLALAGASALGMAQRLRRADSVREHCLAWAVALMVGSFYLVAGPAALAPHFERYGLCLVAPGAVLLALGWCQWLGKRWFRGSQRQAAWIPSGEGPRQGLKARGATVLLATVAWMWLAVFYYDYFLVFRARGGDSHVAFRTAAVEPKLAALQSILQAEQSSGPRAADEAQKQIWIVADSWWSYWPLAYFSAGRPDVHVVAEEKWPEASQRVGQADAVWRVKFAPTRESWLPAAAFVTEDPAAGKTTVRDYAGAPLLIVERLDSERQRPATAAN